MRHRALTAGALALLLTGAASSAQEYATKADERAGVETGSPTTRNPVPLVGTDACPGTPIPALPYNDSDTTIGATSTVGTLSAPSCTGYTQNAGPDKVYTLVVKTAGSLTVTLTPTGATGYDPSVYLLDSAGSACPAGIGNVIPAGRCVGGADAGGGNAGETFTIPSLAAGTYFLFVDSFFSAGASSAGAYTLSITGTAVVTPYRALIVYADSGGPPAALQAQMLAEPGVAAVDLFDATAGTPTLAQLQGYGLVVPFSNSPFLDGATLGNNLADYLDGCGIVVQTGFSFYGPAQPYGLNGRWLTGNYNTHDYTTTIVPGVPFTLGAFNAAHPLMAGVAALNSNFQNTVPLAAGATQVAAASNGNSLVAFRPVGTHTAVGVTAYVGIASTQSGDWGRVAVNAIRWLQPTCVPNPPGGGGGGNNPTSTVLTSSKNPSTLGDSVTFRARIVAQTSGFPSGNVQFRDGGAVLGNAVVNLLGEATLTTSALALGAHTITAFYGGDANFLPSLSALLTQTVSPLPTSTTTLTSSKNPSNLGDSITLTATIAPASATGSVTFKDGATTLGTGTVAAGVATYTTSALTVGTHSLTAVYGGSGSLQGSTSAAVSQVVNSNATTTSVSSSKNPSPVGGSVTFTATVTPLAASGTVTFLDGSTTLGTGTLSGGAATLSTSSLAVGVHPITAVYGGDATYASSTSASLSQAITNAGGCTSGGTDTLCVQSNGRFTVKVAWTNQYAGNTTGVGTAFAITSDSGFFTFFSANNIELVVKVLDGRTVNGKFWVLYGALSDVGYTITVTDTQTSAVKTYVNAPGNLASVSDTNAFAGRTGEAPEAMTHGPATYGQLATFQMSETTDSNKTPIGGRAERADDGACSTSGGTLCLNGGRFQITAAWKNYNDGSTGTGTAIALTADSGYFWFFSSPNVELMLKVLDGRSVNGKFWYLSGALTDVEYTVTVTDTTTGAVKTYVNPAHTLKSLIDITAF